MHRDSQKRIYGNYVYFITCDMHNKFDFFKEEIFCAFWIEQMKLAKEIKKFELFAFCLNYSHFHLLIKPNNLISNYSQIMHFFKRHTSRNLNIILGYNKIDLNILPEQNNGNFQKSIIERDNGNCNKPLSEGDNGNYHKSIFEGDNGNCRLRRDVYQRRIREFDNITYQYRQKYITKFGNDNHHLKFKWQKSFYDHIIRDQKDYVTHWNYTMYNFKKHELPDDWKYTGLNYPELIDEIIF